MPRAVDFRQLLDDKNPLRGLLDFNDILATAEQAGDLTRGYIKSVMDGVVTVIFDQTGIDLSTWNTFLQGVFDQTDVDLTALGALNPVQRLQNIAAFLGVGVDLDSGTFDPVAAINWFITNRLNPTGLITANLDPNARISASQLFGDIGLLSVSSIGDFVPNWLPNATFDTASALDGLDDWTYSDTISHSATGGSAQTIGDGTLKELLSDPATPVAEGQVLDVSQWLRWTGVTATGDAFQLGLNAYPNRDGTGIPVAQPIIDTISNPAAASVNPAEADFEQLAGTWTVPAGVGSVRQRLLQFPSVTAGQSNWDDGTLSPTQLLKESLVEGLAQKLSGLDPTGLLDASKLTNLAGLPSIPDLMTKSDQFQQLNDNLTNALSGNSLVGQDLVGADLPTSKQTMEQLFSTLSINTRKIQSLETQQTASSVGGRQVNINFADYPDGPFPSGLFNITMSGGGSSSLAISGGKAVWNLVDNGDRTARLIYPTPMLTDSMIVRGTMSSPPENNSSGQKPQIWAIARSNAAGTEFVWARGYCTGFLSYKGDIGCINAAGVQVWASNISLTWSLDMRLVCGVGTNARRHQVLSGDTIVWDGTEPVGAQSIIDGDHRFWGSQSQTNGQDTPGAIAGCSVVDNAPPAVIGTTFRASRRSGSDVTIASGGVKLPNNFYETVDYISPDLTYTPGSNCRVTVSKQGTYLVQYRVLHGVYATGTGGRGLLYKNGNKFARGQWGANPFNASGWAQSTNEDATAASFIVPMNPNDYIEPGFDFTNSMSNTGDAAKMADGSESWFAITRVGIT